MAVVLSGLTKYVDESRLDLIRKSVLGNNSSKYFVLQTGVKSETALNLLDTTIRFQPGNSCGWTEGGTSTISQRKINPVHVKVNMSFCDKAMQEYFLQQEVRVAAGQAVLPAEESFVADVVSKIQDFVESVIWNSTNVDGTDKKGLFDIVKEEGLKVVPGPMDDTIYALTKATYKMIPVDSLADTSIYMGIDKFRELVLELTEKNLYHYAPGVDNDTFEIILPGTNTKVRGVKGLNGAKGIVALNDKQTYFGVDMANDDETFDLWYSKDNQEFRLAANFNVGRQVAYPTQTVFCELA